MKLTFRRAAGVVCATLLALSNSVARAQQAPAIVETTRSVPVAGQADVIIVGGSTGAVAAAVAASKSGARVFLVAPRPYLGEDVAGPMRLWLEPGEIPTTDLAKAVFRVEKIGASAAGTGGVTFEPSAVQFRYESSIPSSVKHKDTATPSRLSDGVLGDAAKDSVQYDGDVTLTVDCRAVTELKNARLFLFHRDDDFAVATVTAEVSNDKREWKPAGEAVKAAPGSSDRYVITIPLDAKARFVRLHVKKTESSARVLLGELAFSIKGAEAAPPVAKTDEPKTPAPQDKDKRVGPFRPMQVKASLDQALLDNKVTFLYSSIVSDVVRDDKGNVTGVVIANRAGRQVILGKQIIDATDRAQTARIAGATAEPYPAGTVEFSFTTVGGEIKNTDSVTSKPTGLSYPVASSPKTAAKAGAPAITSAELIEHTVKVTMNDGSFASFARAEQAARDAVASAKIMFLTDELFQIPPDPIKSGKRAEGAWAGADKVDLAALKPSGIDRIWVLGGAADVSREAAAQLVRPTNLMALGERVGAAAAEQAKAIPAPAPGEVKVAGVPSAEGARPGLTVGENLSGHRPLASAREQTVPSPVRGLPVIGEYDIVVVGAGTGGAPAGISGARAKAKTLVIEYLKGLGGVGTAGRVSTYYHGYKGGFTAEVPGLQSWDPIDKAEWWRSEVRKAGGNIWTGCIGGGAVVENGKVIGVIVTTPEKRGVVLAKVVIDATGNSDVARAAGAQTVFMDPDEPAFQGTGLPPLHLGRQYTNTDFTIVDESDMMDVWHVMTFAKRKYADAFDLGQLLDTRERHRIVGEFTMTLPDAMNQRTYPDVIHVAQSNFDTHGFTVDPYLMIEHPQKKSVRVNVPYRCLLPKGLDGILVIGLGVSAHRDVMPLLRMQPDIQNQGYVAAQIAATAIKQNKPLREVDLKPLQEQFGEMEILPRPFVTKDSYPLPDEQIAKAVAELKDGKGAAVIFTHKEKAMPLLKKAFAEATDPKIKLGYAKILGVFGDNAGLDVLIAAIEKFDKWDAGWKYQGMGQYGSALSELDELIVCAGRTRDKRILPVVFKKMELLDASHAFSHHRAVALACELVGDPSAAPHLAAVLAKPGVMGHTTYNVDEAYKLSGNNQNDTTGRAKSVGEVSLARALYRVGDQDGLGKKILTAYTKDLRGYLARHAEAVLTNK